MSKNVIIGLLGTVVVVGGGFWYYQTADGPSTNESSSNTLEVNNYEEEAGMFESFSDAMTGSFNEIIGRGDAVQCRFAGTDPETNTPYDGVVYVAGTDIYLEADTIVEGNPIQIKMIQNDSVIYLWSDNTAVMPGIKFTNTMEANSDDMVPPSPLDWLKESDEAEYDVDYSCQNWSPDTNLFQPPVDVEFMDMMGMMMGAFGGMMGDMGDMSGMMEEEMGGMNY